MLGAIQTAIEFERPTILGVAAVLSVEPRTLQRHLAACGLTFLQLLEGYRIQAALVQHRAREKTVTDIDFGFSDSAHFSRAFRRWTGLAPSDVQRALDAADRDPGRCRKLLDEFEFARFPRLVEPSRARVGVQRVHASVRVSHPRLRQKFAAASDEHCEPCGVGVEI